MMHDPKNIKFIISVITTVDRMFVRANLTLLFTYVCLESLFISLFVALNHFLTSHFADHTMHFYCWDILYKILL
jgi:hypothetical protein